MKNNEYFKKLKSVGAKDKFIKEILEDYHKSIDYKINLLKQNYNKNKNTIVFLENLKNKNTDKEYSFLRNTYLSLEEKYYSTKFKYLHPFHYFCDENRIDIVNRLNIITSPPMKILDIGTGAGHFPAMASYYGHKCLGLDVKYEAKGCAKHVYDALSEFYEVDKVYGAVNTENGQLDNYDMGKFNLITAFAIYFNKHRGSPWGPNVWRLFLKNLHDNFLEDGGKVLLSLVRGKTTDESWKFLTKYSDWNNKNSLYILIPKNKISKL